MSPSSPHMPCMRLYHATFNIFLCCCTSICQQRAQFYMQFEEIPVTLSGDEQFYVSSIQDMDIAFINLVCGYQWKRGSLDFKIIFAMRTNAHYTYPKMWIPETSKMKYDWSMMTSKIQAHTINWVKVDATNWLDGSLISIINLGLESINWCKLKKKISKFWMWFCSLLVAKCSKE